ncbi:MAG: hypothetical protein ACYC1U_09650 [Candidatus Aquicultorales bacterium]
MRSKAFMIVLFSTAAVLLGVVSGCGKKEAPLESAGVESEKAPEPKPAKSTSQKDALPRITATPEELLGALSGSGKIAVKVGGDFAYSDPQYPGKDVTITNYQNTSDEHRPSWSGTSMSVTFTVDLGARHGNDQKFDVTINATVSQDGKTIESLTAVKRSYGTDTQGYNWEEIKELTLANISLASYGKDANQVVFQVRGSSASANAAVVRHTFTTANPARKSYALDSIKWSSATPGAQVEVAFFE